MLLKDYQELNQQRLERINELGRLKAFNVNHVEVETVDEVHFIRTDSDFSN